MEDKIIFSFRHKSHIVVHCVDCDGVVLFTSLDDKEADPKVKGDKLFLITKCRSCEEADNNEWGKGERNTEASAFLCEEVAQWMQYKKMNSYLGDDLKLPNPIMPISAIVTVPQEKIKNGLEDGFVVQTVEIEYTAETPLVVRPYLNSGFF